MISHALKISGRRKWLFRLTAAVILPLLLLAGIELGLRVAGYGYPTGFFKRIRIGQQEFLVENDKFGLRFFPPELARSPAPIVMRAQKPPGTYRIFILGESAALGDPRPAYAAGRYLQVLLQERFPDAKFEVVCAAMTAINSHAILPIASECAAHQGDFWILYMGNNEMVGPFGATTIFGPQAPPLSVVRLRLAIQRTRLGQLLAAWGRKLKGGPSNAQSWAGMEMFMNSRIAAADPGKEKVYRNFRKNLEDILQAGLGSGARIILSTVAVNLKDCPPFASLPSTNSAAAEKLFTDGSAAERQGDFARAAECFGQATTLDPQRAELEFRLAECRLHLTNATAALQHFERARDLDALPFRADSRINTIISELGRQHAGQDLAFLDAAALFASNSPAGIPGQESFYEHVHFNFDGNYRLARAWAAQIERWLAPAATNRAAAAWPAPEICERRLGLTDWNRAAVLEDMIRRMRQPPFSGQSNQSLREEGLRAQLHELRQRMDPAAASHGRALYQEALQRAPEDHRLHENYAEFLEAIGDLQTAAAEWRRVRELTPHHHVGYFQAGRLLARQGRLADAQPLLSQAVALRPDLTQGWLELGKIHTLEGKFELALQENERARQLLPQNQVAYYQLGKVLSKMNRRAAAIAQFRQAVRLRSDYWEAHYALGEELAFDGQTPQARGEFQKVLQLKPDYPMAHFNLGVALAQQGELDNALQQFEEALRLDPQNQLAQKYLEKVRARKARGP